MKGEEIERWVVYVKRAERVKLEKQKDGQKDEKENEGETERERERKRYSRARP